MRALAATVALMLVACASATHRQCAINSDCGKGKFCQLGACAYECRIDLDCATGYCETQIGRCLPVPDGGRPVDMLPAGSGDLAGAAPADLGATPPLDLVASPSPDLSTVKPSAGAYGDVCSADSQCLSTVCARSAFVPSDKECAGPCASGCMLGDVCVSAVSLCAPSDVGASCVLSKSGADCRQGLCLGNPQFQSSAFCTRACASAADCPAGYTCSSTGGSPPRVCVRVDSTFACSTDAGCFYGTRCDAAHGRCLGDCRGDADCPRFHRCTSGLCAPTMATGGGGLDAPCSAATECRSGACLLGKCLTSCGVTSAVGQWCPGGYGCNPVSDGAGGYILGCLVAGTGSLGATCSTNTDCASGVCLTDGGGASYCTRFCNSAPCPSVLPTCASVGAVADGVALMACSR